MICEKCKDGGLLDLEDHFEWCKGSVGMAVSQTFPRILQEGNEIRSALREVERRLAA